jgi:hypothetical protein
VAETRERPGPDEHAADLSVSRRSWRRILGPSARRAQRPARRGAVIAADNAPRAGLFALHRALM